jgi:predicted nucleotidyltransferase
MNQRINKYLNEIEQENKIKILIACEAGSRAWGFPSPDSDYDKFFIKTLSGDDN